MKANQTVQDPLEKSSAAGKQEPRGKQGTGSVPAAKPEGVSWQFKALIGVIAFFVVLMILRTIGLV